MVKHLGCAAMGVPNFDVTSLPGKWWAVDGDSATSLEQDLRAQVTAGHPLHDVPVMAVAVRRHFKDVVFWVPSTRQWALVHLTGRLEPDPRWPSTALLTDWSDVLADLID